MSARSGSMCKVHVPLDLQITNAYTLRQENFLFRNPESRFTPSQITTCYTFEESRIPPNATRQQLDMSAFYVESFGRAHRLVPRVRGWLRAQIDR